MCSKIRCAFADAIASLIPFGAVGGKSSNLIGYAVRLALSQRPEASDIGKDLLADYCEDAKECCSVIGLASGGKLKLDFLDVSVGGNVVKLGTKTLCNMVEAVIPFEHLLVRFIRPKSEASS